MRNWSNLALVLSCVMKCGILFGVLIGVSLANAVLEATLTSRIAMYFLILHRIVGSIENMSINNTIA